MSRVSEYIVVAEDTDDGMFTTGVMMGRYNADTAHEAFVEMAEDIVSDEFTKVMREESDKDKEEADESIISLAQYIMAESYEDENTHEFVAYGISSSGNGGLERYTLD